MYVCGDAQTSWVLSHLFHGSGTWTALFLFFFSNRTHRQIIKVFFFFKEGPCPVFFISLLVALTSSQLINLLSSRNVSLHANIK